MTRALGIRVLLLVVLAAFTAACGGGGGGNDNGGDTPEQATWDNFNWDDGSTWQ